MTAKDLLKKIRERPFAPFRLVISEGGTYEIRHPDQIMVARDSVVIGLPCQPEQDFYDTTTLVDIFHVVRLEPIPPKTAVSSNA